MTDHYTLKSEWNKRVLDAMDSPVPVDVLSIKVLVTKRDGVVMALGLNIDDWPDLRKGIYILSKAICSMVARIAAGKEPESDEINSART